MPVLITIIIERLFVGRTYIHFIFRVAMIQKKAYYIKELFFLKIQKVIRFRQGQARLEGNI